MLSGQYITIVYIFVAGYLLLDPVNAVHCCGQITMWYYIPVKTGTITFSVWRKTGVKRYKLVETNTVVVQGTLI